MELFKSAILRFLILPNEVANWVAYATPNVIRTLRAKQNRKYRKLKYLLTWDISEDTEF
jgi:hypothetical protein